jgi:hypothetical protein
VNKSRDCRQIRGYSLAIGLCYRSGQALITYFAIRTADG